MKTIHCILFAVLSIAVWTASPATAEDASHLKIFNGEPRLFVVNGYSTSYQWPRILQRKLDRYFDGNRIIEVEPATKGGTPIAKWMDVNTGERLQPWEEILQPALQKSDNRPVVVLAQQSLQWVFGDRRQGIRNAQDQERISFGASVLQKYAQGLLDDEADHVFIAMHIYKTGMEPEIGNERLALARFLENGLENVHGGPDVWIPTKARWPEAFARDKVHPNSLGAEIMAHYWFETLLAHDELETPAGSIKEVTEAAEMAGEDGER